jgi:hypothetical protein
LVNNGNDDIPVNNQTFGDPNVGAKKSFGIIYASSDLNHGVPIALGCGENATLDLMPTPPTAKTTQQNVLQPVAGAPQILFASYGATGNGNDVTAICQAMVNQGNLTLQANNSLMGPDPQVGATKYLGVLYQRNGQTAFRACAEGGSIVIPST